MFVSLLDEFNYVPQGTCFRKKKSGSQLLVGPQESARVPYRGQQRLVEVLLIQYPNLVELRLLV